MKFEPLSYLDLNAKILELIEKQARDTTVEQINSKIITETKEKLKLSNMSSAEKSKILTGAALVARVTEPTIEIPLSEPASSLDIPSAEPARSFVAPPAELDANLNWTSRGIFNDIAKKGTLDAHTVRTHVCSVESAIGATEENVLDENDANELIAAYRAFAVKTEEEIKQESKSRRGAGFTFSEHTHVSSSPAPTKPHLDKPATTFRSRG